MKTIYFAFFGDVFENEEVEQNLHIPDASEDKIFPVNGA